MLERRFEQIKYTILYVLYGDEPYPEIFVDDIEEMLYIYSHHGERGPTYMGLPYGGNCD